MKRHHIYLLITLLPQLLFGQFSVISNKTFDYGNDSRILGVDAVVIFETIDSSATLVYEADDSTDFEWHYRTASVDSLIVSSIVNDTITELDSISAGLYELRLNSSVSYYYYVIDFEEYQPILDSVWVDDSADKCSSVELFATVIRHEIPVYDLVNDTTYVLLDPETYYVWGDSTKVLSPFETSAPYNDTTYYCYPKSDDFFSSNTYEVLYTHPDTLETEYYNAVALKIIEFDVSVPEDDDDSNTLDPSDTQQGSAPLNVTYTANTLGNVDNASWWIWALEEQDQPNSPTYSGYQQKINHTFVEYKGEEGYRVKVTVNNDFCTASDSSEMVIYESDLQVPNILVLGFGASGKFKVAYNSIDPSTFKASIYNRWGRLVYKWTDIEGGWDGRSPVTNSYVSPGAYYYNIRATGTDGRDYKLIGDVNVIREQGAK